MRILLMTLALAAAEGCSSPCGDMKTAVDSYNQKSCAGSSKLGFTQSTCDQHVSACTDHDDKVVKAYTTCIQDLGTCSSDTQSKFTTDALACGAGLLGLTAECAKAFR